jgi:hypothetical protein
LFFRQTFRVMLFRFLIQMELEFFAEFRILAIALCQPTQPAKKRFHRPS